MILGVLLAIPWFGLFLFVHLGVMAISPVSGRFKVIRQTLYMALIGFSITYMMLYRDASLDASYVHGGPVAGLLLGWLTLTSLFVVYMPFFYTIAASLSVQSLVVLKHLPPSERLIGVLRSKFATEVLVEGRLRVLATNRYLAQQGDSYQLTSKGRLTALVFRRINRFWRLGPGG